MCMFKYRGYKIFDFFLSNILSFSCSECVWVVSRTVGGRSLFAETIFVQEGKITISLNNLNQA